MKQDFSEIEMKFLNTRVKTIIHFLDHTKKVNFEQGWLEVYSHGNGF